MSQKQNTYHVRPEPPDIDQIIKDIKSAPRDDIAFLDIGCRNTSGTLGNDTFSEAGSPVPPPEGSSGDDQNSTLSETESTYRQAVQFLTLSSQLKEAPESLQTQYEHLQKLGTELTQSIDELKQLSTDALR